MQEGRYIGGGVWCKAPSYAGFFGSFLAGTRKEHDRTNVFVKVYFLIRKKNPSLS